MEYLRAYVIGAVIGLGWIVVVKLSSRSQNSEKNGTEKRYSKETNKRLDLVRLKREAEEAATKFDLPNPTIEKFDAFLAAEVAEKQAVIDKIEQEYEASLMQDFVSRLDGIVTVKQEPITTGHDVESLPPWPPRTMEYEITDGNDRVIAKYVYPL